MKKKKYKAVVIGCGKIGVEERNYRKEIKPATHAAAFRNHPKIELVGLADINLERLKIASRYFPGVPLFNSTEKMLRIKKPDIVSIATHSDSHLELVKLSLKYKPRAIVCEKPIAETLKEAKEMIKVCKNSKILLFINHTRRFDPLFRLFQEKIKKNQFGKIVQATGYYYNGLFNNGTHLVDILRFFLGDIDWVLGVENKLTRNPYLKKDLNIDGLLHFKSGTVVFLQSLPANYGFFEFYFLGTRGGVFFRNLGYQIEQRRLVKNKYYKNYYQFSKTEFYGRVRSYMKSMAEHVVDCLDGKDSPVSRGEDGLVALRILFALKESAKNKGKLIKLK